MSKSIKSEVLDNPILKDLLERIESEEEKEKTIEVIESMLEQFQGQFSSLFQTHQDLTKK